jgi:high-affinity nickel-transport protein
VLATNALTVFVLGIRHGADPDHLAAIDGVTRNAYSRAPFFSRFVGTLFAGGHTIMVLAIAALVGFLGQHLAVRASLLETVGTWISIVVLIAIAAVNLSQLHAGSYLGGMSGGVKTRLLPRSLREASSPWLALPIGFLFGFGFETSSQIATYAVAFAADAGIAGAIVVGATFCAGMICTDTMDSVVVHRLVGFRSAALPAVMRVWVLSVTALALVVAAYELAQLLGWRPPFSDLALSGTLVGALGLVFAYVVLRTRRTVAGVER